MSNDRYHDDIALLADAVRIPSVSTHEAAVARFLVAQMTQRGLRSYVDKVGNAVGQVGDHGPQIMLLGHIDTVPGEIPVTIRDGNLYGRGTVDAKGPFVAFICAAAALANQGELPFRLTLVGAVEEEYATSRGAHYVAHHHHPDACIIGEPSGWQRVTLGYKGRMLLDISTTQASAHSAGPQPSAPERCMAVWQRIQHYCDQHNQHQPLLFDQILPSLRQINSGSDGLTDWAQAMVGIRIPPATMIDLLIDAIAQLADAHTSLLFRAACGAWQSSKNNPCATAFISAIRQVGGTPGYLRKTGTADMNVVAPIWQCPIIAYGPGDSSLDHTPHEHVSITEFGKGVDTLIAALPLLAQRLASSPLGTAIG